jgi:hypothetical protein
MKGDAARAARVDGRWRLDRRRKARSDAGQAVVTGSTVSRPELLGVGRTKRPLAISAAITGTIGCRQCRARAHPWVDSRRRLLALRPMEQGIPAHPPAPRFAARETRRPDGPVQLGRVLMPVRRASCSPLGRRRSRPSPWMGSRRRICRIHGLVNRARARFPAASGARLRPYAHWGLTLGPATGRLLLPT